MMVPSHDYRPTLGTVCPSVRVILICMSRVRTLENLSLNTILLKDHVGQGRLRGARAARSYSI